MHAGSVHGLIVAGENQRESVGDVPLRSDRGPNEEQRARDEEPDVERKLRELPTVKLRGRTLTLREYAEENRVHFIP